MQRHVPQRQAAGVARDLAVAVALRAGGGRGVRSRAARGERGGAALHQPLEPFDLPRLARRGGGRGLRGRGLGRRRPTAATAAQQQRHEQRREGGSHGTNGSPGSAGASLPASQRSAEAPTSASGPSWRAPAVAGEAGQQRRVLARVVGAGGGRVAAVVGGEDEEVALRVEPLEPAADRRVDDLERLVEAGDVAAVAVDLVGLDEVGEHEAAVELVDQVLGPADRLLVGGARVAAVDADAREHLLDLADRVDRDAVGAQLLEVGAAGRLEREVAAAGGALERARLAAERARDDAADGVLAAHDLARRLAGRVELGGRHLVDVRGDLEHRVGRGVDDQVAGREVLLAVVLDRVGAAVGLVEQDAAAGRVDQLVEDLVGEAVGVGPQRHRRDDAHQLPVAGDRVLARAERVQAAVEDGRLGGRDALERQDRAEPEAAQHRQVEAAGRLGDVAERVGAGVAVVGGVGQLARPARIQDDDEGAAIHARDCVRGRDGVGAAAASGGAAVVGML